VIAHVTVWRCDIAVVPATKIRYSGSANGAAGRAIK
jgi:hypothetical protein